MSVFVDDAELPYGRMIMCHMIADTQKELHDMAGKIGIKRKWYHEGHYNICLSKRREAVQLGAVEITKRQCALIRAAER